MGVRIMRAAMTSQSKEMVEKAPAAAPGEERAPLVWLLLDDRPGHTTQAVGLAEALGWPYERKTLAFTALNRIDTSHSIRRNHGNLECSSFHRCVGKPFAE